MTITMFMRRVGSAWEPMLTETQSAAIYRCLISDSAGSPVEELAKTYNQRRAIAQCPEDACFRLWVQFGDVPLQVCMTDEPNFLAQI